MLKRWISGILLAALTLACLLAGGYWWDGLLIIGLGLAGMEWAELGGSSRLVILPVAIAGYMLLVFDLVNFIPLLLFIPLIVILWSNNPAGSQQFMLSASALLWLSFPFYFLFLLRRGYEVSGSFVPGTRLLGILILVTVLQNTLAYYAGLYLGTRSTFFAGLSPNKSTGGFLGGFAGVAVAFILAYYAGLFPLRLALLLTVGLGTAGPAGDLLISAFKRESGLDDTGDIIPGHGGVLDRIDSLLANSVVFYLLLNISVYFS